MNQNVFGEYIVHISAPKPRPKMLEFVEFLWGCVPFDSDIDTKDPHSTEWKELTIANRTGHGRIDVDILEEEPLVLKVRSKDLELVLRASKYLADHCGGDVLSDSASS